MPSVFTINGYKVFIWSGDSGEPVHVHVTKGKPNPSATKIWLTAGGGCIVAHNKERIPEKDLRAILGAIASEAPEIIETWVRFFSEEPRFYC